jgi:quercetin dioxygenase-like cupin family protein
VRRERRTIEVKVVDRDDSPVVRIFNGVAGRIVFSSERLMFLLVEIAPRGQVPMHRHPHEQMGLCLKGRAAFSSETDTTVVEEGTFYRIPPGETHSVVSLADEPSLFLDVFAPPREDYLMKAGRKSA